MLITDKPFNGIYLGKDVDAEVDDYMAQLEEYCMKTVGRPTPYPIREKKIPRVKVPDKDYLLPGTVTAQEKSRGKKSLQELYKTDPDKVDKILKFWEREQKRYRNGYDGIVGTEYVYYNWAKLPHTGEGMGPIDFRQFDNMDFALKDACLKGDNEYFQGKLGWGIICVGCRQNGKTSRGCMYGIGELTHKDGIVFMIASKKKEDAEKKVFRPKFKSLFKSIPAGLKPPPHITSLLNTQLNIAGEEGESMTMFGGGDAQDMEGATTTYLFWDEAVKTRDLKEKIKNALPMLEHRSLNRRAGLVELTGVAGEMEFLKDFIVLWKEWKSRKFVRWFIPGWVKLNVDEFGNNDIRAAVRSILMERHSYWMKSENKDPLNSVLEICQQKPLTVEECFLQKQVSLFPNNILKFYGDKVEEHFEPTRGYFDWGGPGEKPKFIPADAYTDGGGNLRKCQMTMLGRYKPDFHYSCGLDVYGIKQRLDSHDGSEGAFYVWAHENPNLDEYEKEIINAKLNECWRGNDLQHALGFALQLGDMPVMEYVDGPLDINYMIDQCVMASMYYSRNPFSRRFNDTCKMLIELQPDVMHYAIKQDHPQIVQQWPLKPGQRPSNELKMRTGVKIDKYFADERIKVIRKYVEVHCNRLFTPRFLTDAPDYNPDRATKDKVNNKKDSVDGMFVTILGARDPRIAKHNVPRGYRNSKRKMRPKITQFPGR
jgi:hypothetical protein